MYLLIFFRLNFYFDPEQIPIRAAVKELIPILNKN